MNQADRLHLNGGSISIDFDIIPPRKSDDIVRDIQIIHDRTISRPEMWTRRQQAVPTLHLEAAPHGIAYALFQADIMIPAEDEERVRVWFNEPARPSQAAGWAALQLYGELATGGPILGQLDAFDDMRPEVAEHAARQTDIDPVAAAVPKFENLRPGGMSSLRREKEAGTSLMFLPHKREEGIVGSRLTLFSDRQLSLPDALWRIKAGYDELLPRKFHPTMDTSAIVAGIVGAENLEDFSHAWQIAAERSPDKPAQAAQTLLVSGAFIATKSPPRH